MKTFIIQSKKILILIFWLCVWLGLALIVKNGVILPSPIKVFSKLLELVKENTFWISCFSSLAKTLIGFILALIIGSIIGVLTYYFKFLKEILSPILLIIKTAPIVSFILITLFFIHSYYVPTIIAMIMVIPIVWENVHMGLINTNKKYLQMAKVYNFSKKNIFKHIYIPQIMPYFISSGTIGIGFAWKSAITAELISSTKYGIGNQIYLAKLYIETESIFAWTIIVIILSLLFQKLFLIFFRSLYDTNKKFI